MHPLAHLGEDVDAVPLVVDHADQALHLPFDAAQAVEMNQRLEESGRFDFQLAATLTDDNGQLVAETLGSYAIRNFMGG